MVSRARIREINEFIDEQRFGLMEEPVRLADIRTRMAEIEKFAGRDLLKRSVVGRIGGIVRHYVPLSEWIAQYRREQDIYREHIRKGDLDHRHQRHVRVSSVFELCECWMHRYHRYPYGDIRRLRPFISELLAEIANWEETPHLDYIQELETWYEALAPGGALYPSDEHLAYVERFEAFAEEIIWDSREQEHITIRNFPAPPKVWPDGRWWCTRHLLAR